MGLINKKFTTVKFDYNIEINFKIMLIYLEFYLIINYRVYNTKIYKMDNFYFL